MRMSTSMIYQQNMTGITSNKSLFMKAAAQLSTGKKVINPSDDPQAASQAVMSSQSQAENNQYTLARTFARQNVSMAETGLQGVTATITDIKGLIVRAGGTGSDNDRASLVTEWQGRKEQLLLSKRAVKFSIGGDKAVDQKVDTNRTMTVGHTGNVVFMSLTSNPKPEPDGSPSASNVFESIDIALNALPHLRQYSGVLQADAYGGYDRWCSAAREGGARIAAACWAHARRRIHDVCTSVPRLPRPRQPGKASVHST